jgi:hypothetical protein
MTTTPTPAAHPDDDSVTPAAAILTQWFRCQVETTPELFIRCHCGEHLRLVHDHQTTCAECGRAFVMVVSVITDRDEDFQT